MAEKIVRFYDTVLIDAKNQRKSIEPDFWSRLLSTFSGWNLQQRSGNVTAVDYVGRSVSPIRPPYPHLQIERIRDLTEQLNRTNVTSGTVEPLDFTDPGDRVSEPTYVVPFGSSGRVAIMSPAVQGTRPETLSKYLTLVLGLVTKGYSLDFTPVVDPSILAKIDGADGAVMLEVHVDAGADIPLLGGGVVGDAFRSAEKQELQDASMVLKWSIGRANGTPSLRDALRTGARWVATHAFSSNAKVKLATLDEDGRLRRDELRSLFDDRVVKTIRFQTAPGKRTPEEEILQAIAGVIAEFTSGDGTRQIAAAQTTGVAAVKF